MEKTEIIEKAKILLKEQNINISDVALELYVDKTIQYILNYCNLYELPDELCYTVIDMVVNACFKAQSNSENGGVSSLSEGGRSVSFLTSANRLAEFQDFDNETKKILNKFKVFYK